MIYWDLFLVFFKIGAVSFGGGYGMISLLQDEVVAHGWLTKEMLMNFIAVAESTPGPIAVNVATFVGSSQGGVIGALLATFGVVLPSFVIILLIAAIMHNLLKDPPEHRWIGFGNGVYDASYRGFRLFLFRKGVQLRLARACHPVFALCRLVRFPKIEKGGAFAHSPHTIIRCIGNGLLCDPALSGEFLQFRKSAVKVRGNKRHFSGGILDFVRNFRVRIGQIWKNLL